MRRRWVGALAVVCVVAGVVLWWLARNGPATPPDGVTASSAVAAKTPSTPARPIPQRIPVALEPTSAGALSAARNGGFEGRVVDATTGAGLPGAQLTFSHDGQTSSVGGAVDGAFHFEPHAAGRWLLAAATAPGHLPFAPEWGQSPVLLDARPGESVRGVVVALMPALEIDGRVVDAQGAPVAAADVVVFGGGIGTTVLVPLVDRFRTDGNGAFRFTAPDDATVEATREGFAPGRARVDRSVRLSRKLTIQLAPSARALLSIDGTVLDPAGAPAEGALVSAFPKQAWAELPATARASVEGRFTLRGLSEGTWSLTASRPGSASAASETPAGASGVRLQLKRGGALAGHVRDKRTGEPIAPFTVAVQGGETHTLSIIDASGTYSFDDLSPGPATVWVVAPGHAPSPQVRVTIPEPGAGTAAADFELSNGGSLAGTVVDKGTHEGIAGALVQVEGGPPSAAIPVLNQTSTDGDGGFVLSGLAESTIGVEASAQGHHARLMPVPSVSEGETAGPLTIELTALQPGEDAGIQLAGIGMQFEKRGDYFVVTRVIPGGGAAEMGLGPGDELTAINGLPAKAMTFADAVPLLRGPEGTTVTLVVLKGGNPQDIVTVAVPRRVITA
jgi:hypothetical protein